MTQTVINLVFWIPVIVGSIAWATWEATRNR